MNVLFVVSAGVISAFIGFAVGRYGDKYGGQLNTPHHWIYGLALMIIGGIFLKGYLAIIFIAFGFGHFISDLNDFLHMRLWGRGEVHTWKFWSIR